MGNIKNQEPFVGWVKRKKAVCHTCKHRNGKPPFADGPLKAYCIKYPREGGYPKPTNVVFFGADCTFYEFDPTATD